MNGLTRLAIVLAVFLTAACEEDPGPAPTAPPPPPPPPAPEINVSFEGASVRVPEGETRDITVSYEASNLPGSLEVGISALDLETSSDDYTFSPASITVSGGASSSGTGVISFSASADNRLAEGDERVALRLVPAAEVTTNAGPDLEVVVADRRRESVSRSRSARAAHCDASGRRHPGQHDAGSALGPRRRPGSGSIGWGPSRAATCARTTIAAGESAPR